MIHRLFASAAALSLLIALLLSAALAWGHFAPTEFIWARGGVLHQLVIGRSTVLLATLDGWP